MTAEDDLDADLATVRVQQANWRAPAAWAAAAHRQLWPPAHGSDIQGRAEAIGRWYPESIPAQRLPAVP